MEYAPNGTINDYLIKSTVSIGWDLRLIWTLQLLNAISYLHKTGCVHRDIRCVNILLDENLDAKLSDFGVCFWHSHLGSVKTPQHYTKKDVYEVKSDQETIQFNFDLRLFGIVLSKMLLFGEEVDTTELFDWKSQKITQDIPCSFDPYKELIGLCFGPQMTANALRIYIISVITHMRSSKESNNDIVDLFEKFVLDAENIDTSIEMMQVPDHTLLESLKQWSKGEKSNDSPIPQFIQQLKKMDNARTADLITILEQIEMGDNSKVVSLIDHIKKKKPFCQIGILALGYLGKRGIAAKDVLIKILNDNAWPNYQLCAAEALLRLELVDGAIEKIGEVVTQQMTADFEEYRLAASKLLPLLAKYSEL